VGQHRKMGHEVRRCSDVSRNHRYLGSNNINIFVWTETRYNEVHGATCVVLFKTMESACGLAAHSKSVMFYTEVWKKKKNQEPSAGLCRQPCNVQNTVAVKTWIPV